MVKSSTYKIRCLQEGEKQECCGFCRHAYGYNEDRDCWCNKHECDIDEYSGHCDDYEDGW